MPLPLLLLLDTWFAVHWSTLIVLHCLVLYILPAYDFPVADLPSTLICSHDSTALYTMIWLPPIPTLHLARFLYGRSVMRCYATVSFIPPGTLPFTLICSVTDTFTVTCGYISRGCDCLLWFYTTTARATYLPYVPPRVISFTCDSMQNFTMLRCITLHVPLFAVAITLPVMRAYVDWCVYDFTVRCSVTDLVLRYDCSLVRLWTICWFDAVVASVFWMPVPFRLFWGCCLFSTFGALPLLFTIHYIICTIDCWRIYYRLPALFCVPITGDCWYRCWWLRLMICGTRLL